MGTHVILQVKFILAGPAAYVSLTLKLSPCTFKWLFRLAVDLHTLSQIWFELPVGCWENTSETSDCFLLWDITWLASSDPTADATNMLMPISVQDLSQDLFLKYIYIYTYIIFFLRFAKKKTLVIYTSTMRIRPCACTRILTLWIICFYYRSTHKHTHVPTNTPPCTHVHTNAPAWRHAHTQTHAHTHAHTFFFMIS